MPRITKLTPQKVSDRVNVFLDGKFATGLNLITATKLGLKVGMIISERELKKLIEEQTFERLLQRAIHYLSYRPRSETEVKTYLQGKWRGERTKEEHRKTVGRVFQKLKEEKLIDDKDFVRWWIEERQAFRPKGTAMLRAELRDKGVGRELIEEMLSDIDEKEAGIRVAKEKIKRLKSLEPKQQKQKLVGFLMRRGFRWDTIKSIIDEIVGGEYNTTALNDQ